MQDGGIIIKYIFTQAWGFQQIRQVALAEGRRAKPSLWGTSAAASLTPNQETAML